ncbi:MAG TPA: hypothetical protein VFO94_13810 [Gammaproteobacteria bacterium]|nr:hypothetical protein [Gammaproteobacteria bacterium]
MGRTYVWALIALLAAAVLGPSAFAQVPGFPAKQGRIDKDVPACAGGPGGSRARSNCEPGSTPKSARTTQEFKLSIEPRAQTSTPACEVTVVTNYVQRNTSARVNGSIGVKQCPMGSTGTYTVVLRTKDAHGEAKSMELVEAWQSGDSGDVQFTADYPLGRDVELLNVRVRNLRCTCIDSAPAATQTSTASTDH